jgi:hypothetical protein
MQGRHLRPSHYLGNTGRVQLVEIDVTPKVGAAECDLTPIMADMSDMQPLHITTLFGVYRVGQESENCGEDFWR